MKVVNVSYIFSRIQVPRFTLNKSDLEVTKLIKMEETIPIVFNSLPPIMNILNKNEYKNEESVKKIMDTYNAIYSKYGHLKNKTKKYPFIVFEGLDGTGKTTLSRKTANKYNASLLSTPPKSITDVRGYFDDHLLRTPYYCLGNYIAELEVHGALEEGPVILDRYWHSTTVYALAQSVQDGKIDALPPTTDEIYKWPADLLQPDLVLLLVASEENRRKRFSNRKVITNQEEQLKANPLFRQNVLKCYENMQESRIKYIDSNGTIKETMEKIVDNINYLFKN